MQGNYNILKQPYNKSKIPAKFAANDFINNHNY